MFWVDDNPSSKSADIPVDGLGVVQGTEGFEGYKERVDWRFVWGMVAEGGERVENLGYEGVGWGVGIEVREFVEVVVVVEEEVEDCCCSGKGETGMQKAPRFGLPKDVIVIVIVLFVVPSSSPSSSPFTAPLTPLPFPPFPFFAGKISFPHFVQYPPLTITFLHPLTLHSPLFGP